MSKLDSDYVTIQLTDAERAAWRAAWQEWHNKHFAECETDADRAWFRRPIG